MKDRSNKLVLLLFGSLACLALTSIVNADGRLFVLNLENSTGLMGFREAERACASLHARLASSAELRHAVAECFFSACTRGWLYGGTVGTTVCNVVGGALKAVDVKTENATEGFAHLNAFCIKDRGVPCGDPPSFPNARRQGHSGYEMGDELLYTCVPGFVMPSGHRAFSLLCDSCGEWYGTVELCVKDESEGLVDYEDKFPDTYRGVGEQREQRAEEAQGEVQEEIHGAAHTGWKPSQQHQETTFSLEQAHGDVTGEGDVAANGVREEEKVVGEFVGHPISEQEPGVPADAATEAPVSLLSQKHMFWFPSEAFQDEVTQRDSTIQSEESKENESQEMNNSQKPIDPDDSHESDRYGYHDTDDHDDHDSHHERETQDYGDHDDQQKPLSPAQHEVQDGLDHPRNQDDPDEHYDMGEHDDDRSPTRYEGQQTDDLDDAYDEHESYEDHEDETEDHGDDDDQQHLDDSQEHPDHDEEHDNQKEDDRDHYTDTDHDDDHNHDDDNDDISDDHDDHHDLTDDHRDHDDHDDEDHDDLGDDRRDHDDHDDDPDDPSDDHDDHDDHLDHHDHDEQHHSDDHDDHHDHDEQHHSDDHDDLSDDHDDHDDHDNQHHDNDDDDLTDRTDENDPDDDNDDNDHHDRDDHDDHKDHDHTSYEDHDSREDVKDYHVIFSITRDRHQNMTAMGDGVKATTDETWLDGYPVESEDSAVERSTDEDKDTGAFNEVESQRPVSHTSLPEESKSSSKEPPLQQEGGQETRPGFVPTANPTLKSHREHAAPTRSWVSDLTQQSSIDRDPAPPARDSGAITEEHTMHSLPGESGERGETEGEIGEMGCTGESCPPPASAGQSSKVASIIVVVCLVAIAAMVGVWCYRRQQQKSSVYEMNAKGQSQSRPAQQMEMQQKV